MGSTGTRIKFPLEVRVRLMKHTSGQFFSSILDDGKFHSSESLKEKCIVVFTRSLNDHMNGSHFQQRNFCRSANATASW